MRDTVIRGPLPKAIRPSSGFTATADVGVTARSYGNEQQKTIALALNCLVDMTDDAGVGQWGVVDLGVIPAGKYLIGGAMLEAVLTLLAPFIDAANVEIGIGTSATADGAALAAGEKNVLAVAAANATLKVSSPDTGSATGLYLDAAVDQHLYLNVRVVDNALHATTADNPLVGNAAFVLTPLS